MRSIVSNVLKEGLNLTAMLTLYVYSSEATADIGRSLWESNAQGPCTEMATERLCLNQCKQGRDANDYVMKHAGNKDMYNRSETGDLKLYIQQSPSVERPMQRSAELNLQV